MTDRWNEAMQRALDQARRAPGHGDVPVGAVLVDPAGRIVAEDHNRREANADPTAHAEILVLRAAATASWRLDGHTLVVTLEPCAMCAGAAVLARLERIVYGAADLRAGACWSLHNIPQDERLNHHVDLVAGVAEDECRAVLDVFFAARRLENEADRS
jgi:tRNA(adenine34) deaminase